MTNLSSATSPEQAAEPEPLGAPLVIRFDYTRSLGPVLSRFATGLRERRIQGVRGADGRVHAPPLEYDPVTAAPLSELVDVGPAGAVVTWSWQPEPLPDQPLDRPFAWALIRLDGADTPMLHAVDAPHGQLRTGLRVRPRWAAERGGGIRDIVCFEPDDGERENGAPADSAAADSTPGDSTPGDSTPGDGAPGDGAPGDGAPAKGAPASSAPADGAPKNGAPENGAAVAAPHESIGVTMITTPVNLEYWHTASREESRFLRGLVQGRLFGQRCPVCGKVYVPPRGACPVDGVPTTDEVELPDKGTITTFCVVNVPHRDQRIKPPYVTAYVLLDGADIAFQHLILECPADEVRMGMRVEAVWRPESEWGPSLENIDHFRPSGEPDAPYESYARHL